MAGFGEAIAYGAVTIINAISIEKGAALGADLWTKARVQLNKEAGIVKGRILSDPREDTTLMKESVSRVLKHFQSDKEYGAYVETESNIPIAKGLKSSSVAANAIILATLAAFGRQLNDVDIIGLGVDASVSAKTTITGAFDDACASFFGNVVITDNLKRRILKRYEVKTDFLILFHVPDQKSYTFTSNVKRMKIIAPYVEVAFREAFSGNYWTALTLNGILYAVALGYEPKIAMDALSAGAKASGLSGKGPATAAIVPKRDVNKIIDAWRQYGGTIIKAKINRKKARILRKK
ncbi:MAG: shikimate kinase [Candidatus Bathyarchaeota archaeon]|nr:MAG: shikimate kinase [Candidatus Bathyarchaeota archaeon]